MRRILLLFFLTASLWAQIDTESVPPELDQRDLYARAASSTVIIIGTVIKSEGRSERVPEAELQDRLNKGTVRHGSLETIQVDEIVCRQSDFDSQAPTPVDTRQPFYMFVPFDESGLPDGQYREELLPNRQYLLLLTDVDSAAMSKTYQLDPDRTYYRGEEHNRGVIPLLPQSKQAQSQNPPEVVDKFRKLCDAMRPPKLEEKLALLQHLADSGDPVLEHEAAVAIKTVRATMQRKSQM
jgi:hypothetical protein